MHHAGWDRVVYARNLALANPGKYTIRFRAAGRIPTRAQVIEGQSWSWPSAVIKPSPRAPAANISRGSTMPI